MGELESETGMVCPLAVQITVSRPSVEEASTEKVSRSGSAISMAPGLPAISASV